jgi:hypothetical protein
VKRPIQKIGETSTMLSGGLQFGIVVNSKRLSQKVKEVEGKRKRKTVFSHKRQRIDAEKEQKAT